jgi:hypothetical protein
MDLALLAGGTYDALAEEVGVKPGVLRSHAKFRAKTGKYTLTEKGDQLVKFVKAGDSNVSVSQHKDGSDVASRPPRRGAVSAADSSGGGDVVADADAVASN